MRFYVNGCSFSTVHGGAKGNMKEEDTWPVKLSKKIYSDVTLINDSMTGGSNDRIVRKTFSRYADIRDKNLDEIAIIQLSRPVRTEYFLNLNSNLMDYRNWFDYNINKYENITDKNQKEFCMLYEKFFMSYDNAINHTVYNIIRLQTLFESLRIPYWFLGTSIYCNRKMLKNSKLEPLIKWGKWITNHFAYEDRNIEEYQSLWDDYIHLNKYGHERLSEEIYEEMNDRLQRDFLRKYMKRKEIKDLM